MSATLGFMASARKILIKVAIWAVVAIGAGVGAGLLILSMRNPIPEQIRAAVKYPLYYPSKLPAGYAYEKNSAVIKNGALYFRIRKGKDAISIAQQVKPKGMSDLKSIKGFSTEEYPSGQAFLRTSGKPAVVVLTDKTIVNVGGSADGTRDAVAATAKSLEQLK
jgi:hypothetical protein